MKTLRASCLEDILDGAPPLREISSGCCRDCSHWYHDHRDLGECMLAGVLVRAGTKGRECFRRRIEETKA